MDQLPANLAAEQAVLGSILASPAAMFIAGLLEVDDFTAPEHRQIFEAVAGLHAQGRIATPVTLGPQFAADRIGQMSVAEYLARLVTVSVPAKLAVDHVRALKEFTARRAMVGIAEQMHATAIAPSTDVAAFNASVVAELGRLSAGMRHARKSSHSLDEAATALLSRLKSGTRPDIISTGLSDLDKVLGGWHRGELAVAAGRPSMGKSAFLFSSLLRAARKGVSSLIFSLEMRHEAVTQRMLSDFIWNRDTPIPYEKIAKGDLAAHEIDRLTEAAPRFGALPIRVDDQAGLSMAEISVRARRHQDELARQGKRLDIVAVDHLGRVAASDRYAGQRVHETGELIRGFAMLAREMGVAFLVLQQLNRGVEGRESKRPGLSDLRDSGNIEEEADTVAFVYRSSYYLQRSKFDDHEKEMLRREALANCENTIEILVGKNRNGPCDNLELFISLANNAVRDRGICR